MTDKWQRMRTSATKKMEHIDAKADEAVGGVVSALLKLMASPWTAWILFIAAAASVIVLAVVCGG
jgi:hypothetical protein